MQDSPEKVAGGSAFRHNFWSVFQTRGRGILDQKKKKIYIYIYIGWPRKNATTLIVNFKDIINNTELIFILLCGKLIFQQNDTMIINFG